MMKSDASATSAFSASSRGPSGRDAKAQRHDRRLTYPLACRLFFVGAFQAKKERIKCPSSSIM
jgi:hypothetical protein